MTVELPPAYICAEFCPLGRQCSGELAVGLKDALDSAADPNSTWDGDKGELTEFVEGLRNCTPRKVGEAVLHGEQREVYQCDGGVGEPRQFIF
jgi:hypothetical protein